MNKNSQPFYVTSLTDGSIGSLNAIDGSKIWGGNKAICITDTYVYFYNLIISSDTENPPNLIKPLVNGENKKWKLISTYTNNSVFSKTLLPLHFSLDDNATHVSRGSAFGMISTLNFAPSADGAIWTTTILPFNLNNENLKLQLIYTINDAQDNTSISFETTYWVYDDSETPDISLPTNSYINNIDIGTTANQRESFNLSEIPIENLKENNNLTLKFTRFGSSDNYDSNLNLLSIILYQS